MIDGMPKERRRLEPSPSAPVLALQLELQRRLVSSGGRPSDQATTFRRLITLRRTVWKDLRLQAARLSNVGPRVSAGHLAALLIERGLAEMKRDGNHL